MFDEFAKRHQGDVDFVAERVATLGGAHLEPLQGYRRAHGATPFPTGKRGELRLVRVVQAYLHYCAGSREAIESSAKEPAPRISIPASRGLFGPRAGSAFSY
jgi:DNA-binding ferritin-like protein